MTCVAYQLRYHPGFVRTRELLASAAIGKVLSVRAEVGEYLPGFHPYEDYRRMYAAQSALGGGVTLSQIHEIDYLCALFGAPRRVFSMGGHVSSLEVDVDDLSLSLLEFARSDGSPLTGGRAIGRYFAELVSSMILLMGYIMAGFDTEHRALHDRICDTRVIKSK